MTIVRQAALVTRTRLEPPFLAAPAPLLEGRVTGSPWAQDPITGVLSVRDRPEDYEMTYAVVRADAPAHDGPPPPPDPGGDLADVSGAPPRLREILAEVTRGARDDREKAAAIERWLREEGGFTYSLDLPEPTGPDPVEDFLRSRTGYCVQFATTMVLMAREAGIPARLATGFLPGTRNGEEWIVRAADAHAWPELYLPGTGWTRYEPTPAARTGDSAVGEPADPATTAPTDPVTDPPERTPTRRATPTVEDPTPSPLDGQDRGTRHTGVSPLVSAVLLTAALALLVTSPAVAWWRRRRRRRGARPGDLVDLTWRELGRDLADLGLPAPVGATPRRAARSYADRLADPEASRALTRLVAAVERARYAGPDAAPDHRVARRCREDARTVRGVARTRAGLAMRVRAHLLPADGLARSSTLPGRRRPPEVI